MKHQLILLFLMTSLNLIGQETIDSISVIDGVRIPEHKPTKSISCYEGNPDIVWDKLDSAKVKNAIYQRFIFEADSACALAKNYSFALVKYELAHEYMPEAMYPKLQIEKMKNIINNETYSSFISAANTCYLNEEYDKALNFFKKAKILFPEKDLPENYAKTIEKVDHINVD